MFVDDGSTDHTPEIASESWKGDARFSLVKANAGRAAALNIALDAAQEEICLIADIDDISVPMRVEWTLDYLSSRPHAGCVGFSYFDEKNVYGWGRPLSPELALISARALLGMPTGFPAFAFRKSHFGLKFNPDLRCGIDCDWIFRNLRTEVSDGHYIPRNAVYYRIHDQQISASKRAEQEIVALNCVASLHATLLGELTPQDQDCIRILSGWERPSRASQLHKTYEYMRRLGEALSEREAPSLASKLAILHYRTIELQQAGLRAPLITVGARPPETTYKYLSKNYWNRRGQKLQHSITKRWSKLID